MVFSERLAQRMSLWWGKPRRWQSVRTYTDALHRRREWSTFRSRDDPDQAWHCCACWQRTLINKWNGREFAARHGCRLPDLYRWGAAADVPFERLPADFVIRPVRGRCRQGVQVVTGERDLLWDESATSSDLRQRLRSLGRLGRGLPVLAEEFVRTPAGEYRLPLEFKCHVFGDTVAAVEVIDRKGPAPSDYRYYTPAWEPFKAVDAIPKRDAMAVINPPPDLDELLRLATRLGTAVGTYMRVDFFRTDKGWVFCEFSSTPLDAKYFTLHCQERFGALWDEKFPDAT